ncbi:MAG TPA: 2-C-methyl-D-erythritol 4-phosphate cytidylyltransferase [Tepidisphaeraceae bacterium]|nr:2-C-methyl-D-erythritol 4-phosphate cytidylyltransferase [Tepidisphaeraceae bacterium]
MSQPEPTFSVIVLTAAPTGMGAEAGGAYVKIDGREALLRSVELFANRDNVKQIQVVFLPEDLEEGKRKYGGHFGFVGVKVTAGGPRWLDQLVAALPKVDPDATHVIIHDGARPAVPYTDIDALMAEAKEDAAAIALTSPLRTPLVEVDEGGGPLAFASPSRFQQLLTPQVLTVASLKELATKKSELHASKYRLLKGSPLNVRVGGPGDASLVKAMINMLPKPKPKANLNPFEEAQW